MRSPSSSTCGTASATTPWCSPRVLSSAASPLRPLPKVKSSPVTTPAAPIRSRQHLGHELLGVHRGELGVEFEHQHRVGAGVREQVLALVERGQAERRDIGLEELDRVGVEGRDDRRPPFVESALDRPPDHRLVAEMEAIEIAEGEDAAREVIGDAAVEGQPLHRRAP